MTVTDCSPIARPTRSGARLGTLPASGANAHLVGWGAAQMAHFVETASPVLTSEQRAKLAQRLRDHASHNPSAQATP